MVISFLSLYCSRVYPTAFINNHTNQPSDSFISKYIKEYNKGNIITNVLVEYEGIEWLDRPLEYFVKPDSNNTITIKKVKDSYSREEVIKLLNNFTYRLIQDLGLSQYPEEVYYKQTQDFINKQIQ